MTHEFDATKYGRASALQQEWGPTLIAELDLRGRLGFAPGILLSSAAETLVVVLRDFIRKEWWRELAQRRGRGTVHLGLTQSIGREPIRPRPPDPPTRDAI